MQLQNQAELALLSRNILIQGDGSDFGCRVIMAPNSEGILQGVQVNGCGQLATSTSALQILEAENVSVMNCTVQGSKAHAILAESTHGLRIEHNAVVDSQGSSVSILTNPNAR